jgi:hypothetical protein
MTTTNQRKFVKVLKRYTIAFGYAGIRQFNEFNEIEGGKLHNPRISVNYNRDIKIPEFGNNLTINDILAFFKENVDKRASIEFIDGQPVKYHKNTIIKNKIKDFHTKLEKFIEQETFEFFKSILEPIMVKNGWVLTSSHIGMPVLAEKNEDGEWDNISNKNKDKEFLFEYICYQFISKVEPNAELRMKNEYFRSTADAFQYLQKYIPLEYLKEKNLYYANND